MPEKLSDGDASYGQWQKQHQEFAITGDYCFARPTLRAAASLHLKRHHETRMVRRYWQSSGDIRFADELCLLGCDRSSR